MVSPWPASVKLPQPHLRGSISAKKAARNRASRPGKSRVQTRHAGHCRSCDSMLLFTWLASRKEGPLHRVEPLARYDTRAAGHHGRRSAPYRKTPCSRSPPPWCGLLRFLAERKCSASQSTSVHRCGEGSRKGAKAKTESGVACRRDRFRPLSLAVFRSSRFWP